METYYIFLGRRQNKGASSFKFVYSVMGPYLNANRII